MKLADIEFNLQAAAMVARVTGEIDLSNVDGLRSGLTEGTPNDVTGLVVDLTGVEYLDSSGIQLIYRLREDLRARGQRLQLVMPADAPARAALRLAGVAGQVPSSETAQEALAAIAADGG